MNYEQIKKLAKETGNRVTDLIALAPQNDPFYVGAPAQREKAEWFAELFHGYDFTGNVHIRRVHYRVISQRTPVIMPNGLPYENTLECWKLLEDASKYARYLDLVDSSLFVDRRNPEPMFFTAWHYYQPAITVDAYSGSGTVDLPSFPSLPTYSIHDFGANQRYHIEIWCEKSTINDVLQPLCERYHCNLVTGVGEMSATALRNLVAKRLHPDRPARVFYISDFDPGGQSMPAAASRKCEFYIDKLGFSGDVKFYPIVMTADQVQHYQLPRTPIKETERRAARFEDRHGAGAVELDALEALYPGELARIVRGEISRYYDGKLDDRLWRERSRLYDDLEQIQERVYASYSQPVNELQQEYEQILSEFAARIRSFNSRTDLLWQAIRGDLEALKPDLSDYAPPSPRFAEEKPSALYDSSRGYLAQMASYKTFQGRDTPAGDAGE
jgi:hypothetical protein